MRQKRRRASIDIIKKKKIHRTASSSLGRRNEENENTHIDDGTLESYVYDLRLEGWPEDRIRVVESLQIEGAASNRAWEYRTQPLYFGIAKDFRRKRNIAVNAENWRRWMNKVRQEAGPVRRIVVQGGPSSETTDGQEGPR